MSAAPGLRAFLDNLERLAGAATVPALVSEAGEWSYRALHDAMRGAADALLRRKVRVLATVCDNSAQWVVADLATLCAGIAHVPLPTFTPRSSASR
jgi:long-subunit acyl-CoA synthetase (AMP-forming)